jgi:carbamate kinase
VVTILTQVVVDRDDPSILEPTKFVGPFFKESEVSKIQAVRGWVLKKDADRGWRRVVPSPLPRRIVERDIIRELIERDVVVIACGGGGIPVYVEDDGTYEGVDGVIDKDLAAAVLARDVGAQELDILTAVDRVALSFGTPLEKHLDRVTLSDVKKHLAAKEFPAGSMGPKIEAAVEFLENGGEEVLITSVERASEARKGLTGTRIVPR